MTLTKFSRAGLMALAMTVLLGLFLSVAFDASYAQAPAPGAAPANGLPGFAHHAIGEPAANHLPHLIRTCRGYLRADAD